MKLGEKMKEYMVRNKMNQEGVAAILGFSQPTISRILKDEWDKPADVQKVLGLLGGKVVFDKATGPEYSFVRLCEARPAAGSCSMETSGEVESSMAFRKDWLYSRTRTSHDKLCLMRPRGDSMRPTIQDGDIVLIDPDVSTGLSDNKIYVVRKGRSIFVKRFRQGIDELLFIGDNPEMSYQNLTIDMHEINDFAVIGRVLWIGRET